VSLAAATPLSNAQGARYGLLGLPLAFVALPLYVTVPNHYAREFGVPLALLGTVLLTARLLDAFADPWIGRWIDRLYARSTSAVLALASIAAVLLALGFALLFHPPVRGVAPVLAWATATLALTYLTFSVLTVAHQSWGALLGGDEAQRGRIVAWREGWSVLGVLLASAAPLLLGLPWTAALFAALLLAGVLAWSRTVRPAAERAPQQDALWLPLRRAGFRRLLAVFVLNGIASAIPATLVLFFVQDRLQAPRHLEPAFLGVYFLCAALAIPGWLALVRRWGLARTWLAGMGLAVAGFVWTLWLGPGDHLAFLAVCVVAGIALATDLAVPSALLAGVIADAGDGQRHEGAYFGWWNFAAKLNLALAAGLALPLLAWAGYTPGTRDADGQQALLLAYSVLPCLLKLAAGAALYLGLIRRKP
jgi:glycoside/pentoside/hexuronide:cation symporter, GPH family